MLGRPKGQVYAKAGRLGLGRRSECRICGSPILGRLAGNRTYCSQKCKRAGNTAQHRRYVTQNTEHVSCMTRAWKDRIWGRSNPQIAMQAERIAKERILPKLGFSNLYHVSAANRFFPFDLIGTYNGQRVFIDVTTGMWKTIRKTSQQELADALDMPMYVLFVKPDFSKYELKEGKGSKTVHARIAELVPLE